MKIYLDVCCLNRPFDDQLQERVRLEAEAVLLILSRCENREWTLVGSDVVMAEIERSPDIERRERVRMIATAAREVVEPGDSETERALELEGYGFGGMDALHLACAETAGVDALLTTDDRLLRKSHRLARKLRVLVDNPLNWLAKRGNE